MLKQIAALALILCLANFLTLPTLASTVNQTTSHPKMVVFDFVSLFSNLDKGGLNKLNKEACQFIDYKTMAELSIGSDNWQKLSSKEQQKLTVTLQKLVEAKYYQRWQKIFGKGKVAYLGYANKGKHNTVLKTSLTLGNRENIVLWHLKNHGNHYKVVSLSVGEKDLLVKVQDRFQEKLKKGGFDGLMNWLTQKLEDSKTTNHETASTFNQSNSIKAI